MKHFAILTFILSLAINFGIAKVTICQDKKTICRDQEMCVTWERGCSLGSNCLESGVFETFTECLRSEDVGPSLLPSKSLCKTEEIFARSVDKRCPRPYACPLRLGYNCYPSNGHKPRCNKNVCPFGTFCIVGEVCSDFFCEAKTLCKISL